MIEFEGQSYEIKRCYKCGSRKIAIYRDDSEEYLPRFYIKCKRCGFERRHQAVLKSAIYSWNTLRL